MKERIKILSVVGARPNFMKIAPVFKKIPYYIRDKKNKPENILCHTGQHYDATMSKIFFKELKIPKPHFFLGVGSGSHANQTAKIMIEFEKILKKTLPDYIIVGGDVNSTLACSLTASKLGIKIIHIESGLRSFDKSMPEEVNRILTDAISDILFVTEPSGLKNLSAEGIDKKKMFFVGNTMIDSLKEFIPSVSNRILSKLEIFNKEFVLVTMHRPSNVDNPEYLIEFFEFLIELSKIIKVVFPIHPRTYKNLKKDFKRYSSSESLMLINPVGYLDFISLMKNSSFVITDSGGIQEETTYLRIPCITVRDNTERPVTITEGSNILAVRDIDNIKICANNIINAKIKKSSIPKYWDGKASDRISKIIYKLLKKNH